LRGDQFARQWRIIRAIEASPNSLTVAETAQREEKGFRTIYRDLEALQAAGFPLYTQKVEKANRWAFVDTLKFKESILFLTPPRSLSKQLGDFNPFPGYVLPPEKRSLRLCVSRKYSMRSRNGTGCRYSSCGEN
jgi:hypothetical protein